MRKSGCEGQTKYVLLGTKNILNSTSSSKQGRERADPTGFIRKHMRL